MADFRAALKAFGRGRLDLTKLSGALDSLLADDATMKPRLLRQLETARAKGDLNDQQALQIRQLLEPPVIAEPEEEDDRTIIGPVGGGGVKPPPASAPRDIHEDSTIVAERGMAGTDGVAPNDAGESTIHLDISAPLSVTDRSGGSGSTTGGGYRTGGLNSRASDGNVDEFREISIGSTLAGQFQLESMLGKGGMGTVYKARDLVFDDARTGTRYVAVKILNDEFKRNPESFEALAHEQDRQARLSHPNIVSVRGLHRDGNDVFMVMEFLDGETLYDVIKKRKNPHRLFTFGEAWPVIRALGDALQFAHENRLVHSDFKPGNCFWCRDGKVKVIDFGIARAVPLKSSGAGANQEEGVDGAGERTVFTVSGALTPAYASLEMIRGEDPDPRDDVYALAVVAYELLQLYHPFFKYGRKLSAEDAFEQRLLPAPIKGLTRRQMKALHRGLAFDRAKRTPDVRTFLRELEGHVEPWRNPWIVAPLAAVLLGGPSVYLVTKQVHSSHLSRIVHGLATPSDVDFGKALVGLFRLEETERDRLVGENLEVLGKRTNLTIARLMAADDFDGANAALLASSKLRKGWDLIPNLEEQIKQRRAARIIELDTAIEHCKDDAACVANSDPTGFAGLLTTLGKLNAQHPRLKPDSIASVYANHIQAALARENVELAGALVRAGLGKLPDNKQLTSLAGDLNARRDASARAKLIDQIEEQLGRTVNAPIDAGNLAEIARQVQDLTQQKPSAPVIAQVGARLHTFAQTHVQDLIAARAWKDLAAFRDTLGGLSQTMDFSEAVALATHKLEAFERESATLIADLEKALDTDHLQAGGGPANAVAAFRKVNSSLQSGARLDELRTLLQTRLKSATQRAINKIDFAAAQTYLAAMMQSDDSGALAVDIKQIGQDIEDAQQATESEAIAALRKKRLQSAIDEFNDGLSTLKATPAGIAAALSEVTDIGTLDAQNELVRSGATKIAQRVAELTNDARTKSDFDGALAMLDAAATAKLAAPAILDPLRKDIESARAAKRGELDAKAFTDAKAMVDRLIDTPRFDDDWQRALDNALKQATSRAPSGDSWVAGINGRIANTYVGEVDRRIDGKSFEPAKRLVASLEKLPFARDLGATRLADMRTKLTEAEKIWNAERSTAKLEESKSKILTLIDAAKLADARKNFDAIKPGLEANDPFIAKTTAAFASAYLARAQTLADKEPGNALTFVKEGLSFAPTGAQLLDLQKKLIDTATAALVKEAQTMAPDRGERLLGLLDSLRKAAPEQRAALDKTLAAAFDGRLQELAAKDSEACASYQAIATKALGAKPARDCPAPAPTTAAWVPQVEGQLAQGKLSAADNALRAVAQNEQQLPAYTNARNALANQRATVEKLLADASAAAREGKDADGEKLLGDARRLWTDRSDWPSLPKPEIPPTPVVPPRTDGGGVPCEAKNAGKGQRGRAQCNDMLDAQIKGPSLVVVPAGSGVGAFAMSRYEISVKEFNSYCQQGGSCSASGGDAMPVAGIALKEVEGYLVWLSSKTGQTYRLPTSAEWEHAARGNEATPSKNVNCKLVVGGNVMKGQGLMSVNSGQYNPWGLYNMVGNVQEWVQGGKVRGGAYADDLEKCSPSLEKDHSGAPDAVTGFRVLRELN